MRTLRSPMFLLLVLWSPALVRAAQPTFLWSNFDDPLGDATYPSGISGNKIVGNYATHVNSIQVNHGFLFDGTTFHTLDDPAEFVAGNSTTNGIDGTNVVGWYGDAVATHGFLYDGTSWKQLDDPLARDGTFAYGISGNKIVGYYRLLGESRVHAFVYDGVTYSTLTNPSFPSREVIPYAISGNKIVGANNSAPFGSFLFDGTNWTDLNDPQALNGATFAQGIDGNRIVGSYENITGYHGFLYDGTNWTTLDDPLAQQGGGFGTFVTGISGNTIVGWYLDTSNVFHGFTTTIVPEPSTFVLAMVGALLCINSRARGRASSSRRFWRRWTTLDRDETRYRVSGGAR